MSDQNFSRGDEMVSDMSSWSLYVNKEYDFSVKLPGDVSQYSVEKIELSPEDSLHGGVGEIDLRFSYSLDSPEFKVQGDLHSGQLDRLPVWTVKLVPLENWKEQACPNGKESCWQGYVLGKDKKYVYEAGSVFVDAHRLCHRVKDEQQGFCSVVDSLYQAILGSVLDFSLSRK